MDGLPQPSLNFAYASLPITVCLFESRRLLTVELKSSNMIGKQHCIVHFLNAAMLRGSMLASFLASKSAPAGTNCSAAQQSKAPSVLALILPGCKTSGSASDQVTRALQEVTVICCSTQNYRQAADLLLGSL